MFLFASPAYSYKCLVEVRQEIEYQFLHFVSCTVVWLARLLRHHPTIVLLALRARTIAQQAVLAACF